MMTSWTNVTCGVAAMAAVLVACSDSETTADGSGGSGNTMTTANGGSGNTMTTANGGSGATGGTPSTGGGGSGPTLNGCTRGAATDMTGSTSVTISDVSAWTFNHNACIVVDTGTTVVWAGDFNLHPLQGGESPTEDPSSPISGNTPANGEVSITLADAGEYPYHCGIHSTMRGVVYVE